MSPYSDLYGGLILNATINLYAYCTIEETNGGNISICSYDNNVTESPAVTKELPINEKASQIKGVYNRRH